MLKSSAGVVGATLASAATRVLAAPGPGDIGRVRVRRKTGDSFLKQRAIQDYRQNMAQFGGQMSAPANGLLQSRPRGVPWQFEILVVGSGYGASVAAARIAARLKPGYRLGVLERGREWVPGTFPDRLPDVLQESRLELLGKKKGQIHKPTGLFNVQQFEELSVLSGSGLGGSSLINANVVLRPDADVFTQNIWPMALRDRSYLEPYFQLAEYELGVAQEPWDHTHKMVAQRNAAEYLRSSGARYEPAKLALTRAASCELPKRWAESTST